MMKKNILNYIIVALLLVVASCKSDWYEIKPKGQASAELFYNAKGVDALLTGAYAVLDGGNKRSGDAYWSGSVTNWVWGSVASDDAYKGSSSGDQATINPIEGYYADADNGYVGNRWKAYYDGVVRANDVLIALAMAEDMEDDEKKVVEGQAKFLRAHFYLELTKVYKQVPYIDENTEDASVVPNDHMLWPEIEADLVYAKDNLPESWGEIGRVTKWAASTMLARVYMYQSKFSEALTLLRDVYQNGGFSLADSYEENYLIAKVNNSESILEVQYSVNDGSDGSYNAGWGDALNFPHGGKIGTCCGFFQPTQNFVNAFKTDDSGLPMLDTFNDEDIPWADVWDATSPDEYTPDFYPGNVDPRLDHAVGRPGVPFLDWGPIDADQPVRDIDNGGPYHFKKNMFKKSEKSLQTSTGWATGINANNYRKYRLGHVILWYAECAAEANDLGTALSLVNEVRDRAKSSNVVTMTVDGADVPAANYKVEPYPSFPSKEYALKAIRHEMRLEFGMEGYRFFDLVRWGIASEVLNDYIQKESQLRGYLAGKTFTAGANDYWPIPQYQIDLSKDANGDPVLKQWN